MPAAKVSRRTAGEGLGHTARVYVPEESHRGIVPMNHSNKDGTSSAESEEGRLRIKESAGQSNTCPTQSGEAGVSQGLSGVRTSGSLGRYSSEIRTGCANERPSGSVRGAPGDWCPYRDHQLSGERSTTSAASCSPFALPHSFGAAAVTDEQLVYGRSALLAAIAN
jgi:hypothetical protein